MLPRYIVKYFLGLLVVIQMLAILVFISGSIDFSKFNGTLISDKQKLTKRKFIFVITTANSEPNLFIEALIAHPNVFYHNEPLSRFKSQDLNESTLNDAMRDLANLVHCNYPDLEEYLKEKSTFDDSLFHNKHLRRECKRYDSKDIRYDVQPRCKDPNYLKAFCSRFPIQLVKGSTLFSSFEAFLNISKNVNIIYLVRDPRRIMFSRFEREWCRDNLLCSDAQLLCDEMTMNIFHFAYLKMRFTSQIHQLKLEIYESDYSNAKSTIEHLFKALELGSVPSQVSKYLESRRGSFGQPRKTKELAWNKGVRDIAKLNDFKTLLAYLSLIIKDTNRTEESIEQHCGDVIEYYNYDFFNYF